MNLMAMTALLHWFCMWLLALRCNYVDSRFFGSLAVMSFGAMAVVLRWFLVWFLVLCCNSVGSGFFGLVWASKLF